MIWSEKFVNVLLLLRRNMILGKSVKQCWKRKKKNPRELLLRDKREALIGIVMRTSQFA